MELQLKSVRPEQTDALLLLMEDFYACERLRFEAAYAGRALAQLLSDPGLGRIWWIEREGEVAGYVVLTFSFSIEYGGRNGLIDELYLRPEARGQGLGARVLALLEEECRALGVGVVYLEASRKNPVAVALYRKRGFRDQDRFLLSKRLPWDGLG